MRAAFLFCLAPGLLLSSAGVSRSRDEAPVGYASKPLAKWIEALKDRENPKIRAQARAALGPDGLYAKAAVPALLEALAHKEPPVEEEVAETLADFGPAVVPTLLRALKRPEAAVRAGVAQALGMVRPKAVRAVPALTEAMKDPEPQVRAAVAGGLGQMGRAASGAVPALAAALRDDNEAARSAAAYALSNMGRKASPAIPALIAALKDKSWWVREWAAKALWKIGPEAKAAVPALVACLRDQESGGARWSCAQALGGIGPDAKEAVPALAEALRSSDDMARRWAAVALGQIGPGAKAAVPALVAVAKDQRDPERINAIEALGRIGPASGDAVPVLIEALGVPTPLAFPCTVAEALGGIGPAARAAVPRLAAVARDRSADDDLRKAAAQAVMKIAPEFAAAQGMESIHLGVRLGKITPVKLAPRAPVSEDRTKHIKRLIARLADVEDPDFGMSATLTGQGFAPLPEQGRFEAGLVTDHRLKSSEAFRELVEMGPDALPHLLDALGDKTPTKLKVPAGGMTLFGGELEGNPLNPLERRVLARKHAGEGDEDDPGFPYTLRVGDVCFVAVGQVVGRPYRAVRYQPTAIVIVNSPVVSEALRDRVRALWSGADPAGKLLDSLLLDYATDGSLNGERLDGWGDASDYQAQAALRLLYYFPGEASPLIAARLRSLDGQKRDGSAWMKREAKNGVCTADFVAAVSWCPARPVREALADLARRTDDPAIKKAIQQGQKNRAPGPHGK